MFIKRLVYGSQAHQEFTKVIDREFNHIQAQLKIRLPREDAPAIEEILRECRQKISTYVKKASLRVDELVV